MEDFKPTKYYVVSGLTTLSDRHLRRKCVEVSKKNVNYVRLGKNKNGSDLWLIEKSSINLIGKRQRKPKQIKRIENYFNVEVSVNFNDTCDRAYYFEIVKLFSDLTGFDLVYKIEKQSDDVYSNHLHLGVHATVKDVRKHMNTIIKDHLQRKCKSFHDKCTGEHKSSVMIRKIVDQEAFVNYISKGYDRLGGDYPTYIFA